MLVLRSVSSTDFQVMWESFLSEMAILYYTILTVFMGNTNKHTIHFEVPPITYAVYIHIDGIYTHYDTTVQKIRIYFIHTRPEYLDILLNMPRNGLVDPARWWPCCFYRKTRSHAKASTDGVGRPKLVPYETMEVVHKGAHEPFNFNIFEEVVVVVVVQLVMSWFFHL